MNQNPFVLALTGRSGAGKDTLTRHLVGSYGLIRLSFGDQLREQADPLWLAGGGADLPDHPYGSPGRDNWERENKYKDFMYELAVRLILQDPIIFIRPVVDKIETLGTGCTFVIPDLRSPLELHYLQQAANVYVTRVIRPNNPHPPGSLDQELDDYDLPELINCGAPEYLTRGVEYVTKTLRRLPYNI